METDHPFAGAYPIVVDGPDGVVAAHGMAANVGMELHQVMVGFVHVLVVTGCFVARDLTVSKWVKSSSTFVVTRELITQRVGEQGRLYGFFAYVV